MTQGLSTLYKTQRTMNGVGVGIGTPPRTPPAQQRTAPHIVEQQGALRRKIGPPPKNFWALWGGGGGVPGTATFVPQKDPLVALTIVNTHISRGHPFSCQHGAFSGVGAFVASFVPAECPVGGGMWVIFGKPLERAIRNTPGLHAVLTTCLRFLSALDGACVARCLFLLTGSHHVVIQIHTTCCCFP